MRVRVQAVPAYMVTIQQVVIAVANRFHLPIEHGYDVNPLKFGHEASVKVTAPEWGKDSFLDFVIERDENGIWYPILSRVLPNALVLGHEPTLPESTRGTHFRLDIQRKIPKDQNRWPSGPYPRYSIHGHLVKRW